MSDGSLVLVTPGAELLTTAEAKAHLRVTTADEDGYIDSLVSAATKFAENWCGRQFVSATWRLSLDQFPDTVTRGMYFDPVNKGIIVPRPPLISVTHLKYNDAVDGTQQTLVLDTDYRVSTDSEPGQIREEFGTTWPSTRDQIDAVDLTFVAGWATAGDVPDNYKQAVYLLVGHWFENREALLVGATSKPIELAVDALLGQERMYHF